MSQIKTHYKEKRMTIDEAINCRMNKTQEQAYLEIHNIWLNQRD